MPNVGINFHSGRFWATSIASFRVRLFDFRSCWIVFIHVIWGRPAVLQGEAVNLLGICFIWHSHNVAEHGETGELMYEEQNSPDKSPVEKDMIWWVTLSQPCLWVPTRLGADIPALRLSACIIWHLYQSAEIDTWLVPRLGLEIKGVSLSPVHGIGTFYLLLMRHHISNCKQICLQQLFEFSVSMMHKSRKSL